MKKALITLAVICLVAICTLVVLNITPVDAYLTQLINGTKRPAKDYIIHSDNPGEIYSIDDPALPFIYVENRMLYMSYKGEALNITPDGINVSYYDRKEDINYSLRYRKNCIVSDDGRYVVYVLEFNGMSYLYYCDFRYMTFGFIPDKVNSFELVSIPDVKGPCVLYATGYEANNRLMLFYDGESKLLKEDVKADYSPEHNMAVILDYRHILYTYDFDTLTATVVDHKVTDVYFSNGECNYLDANWDFTVYYAKEDGDYVYRDGANVRLNGDYRQEIPNTIYPQADGYYGLDDGVLTQYTGENKIVIAADIGYINSVLQYDKEGSRFIVATSDSIYSIVDNTPVKLMKLDYKYRYCPDAVAKYMSVYTDDYKHFYFGMLTGGTVLLNVRNTDSWLNKESNLLYGLYYVDVDNISADYKPVALDLPESRSLPQLRGFDTTEGRRVIYTAHYNNGTVRSLSLLTEDGQVLSRDVLDTAGDGVSKNDITVYFANDGVYVMHETDTAKMFYKFSPDGKTLETEMDMRRGDNKPDYIVATSFGEMIIFVLES